MIAVLRKVKQFEGDVFPERYDIRGSHEFDVNVSITIGKDVRNDIIIREDNISRFHAVINEITENGNTYYELIDKNSLNGTYIGGIKIITNYRLKHNDRIAFSDSSNEVLEFGISGQDGQTIPYVSHARLHWDGALQKFWIDKHENILNLTPTEQRVLHYLYNNEGRVCTREEIARMVWDEKIITEERTGRSLDVTMTELRKKMGDTKNETKKWKFIRTERGQGFILDLNLEVDS